MRKYIFTVFIFSCISCACWAQNMKGYYYNEEYQVYLQLSADDSDVSVPGQDIYGELPGYFGSKRDGRLWLITESTRIKDNQVKIIVINDYGSEDFEAILTEDENGTLTMKHTKGSTFKIVVNRKYVKIPKEFILKKEKSGKDNN